MTRHRWPAALALLVAVASSQSGWANPRVNEKAGKAIGGKANPGYKPLAGRRVLLKRPLRASEANKAPSTGPAMTLQLGNHGNVGFLDPQHYKDVREMTLTLLSQHPPEKSFFVSVGRSPVAIASFLAELNPDMVMTFPASDMRLEIKPAWKAHYFDHFKELIPEDVIQSDRTIVLFDRSRAGSGTSLARLKGYLEEYLRNAGSKAKVAAVGFAPGGKLAAGVEHIDTTKHPKLFLYVQGQYDHDEAVAPFPNKHRIGAATLEQLTENPNYWKFRDALRGLMSGDKQLDEVLQKTFAGQLGDGE